MSLVGSERMLRPVCKQMDLFGLAYLVTSLYLSLCLSLSLCLVSRTCRTLGAARSKSRILVIGCYKNSNECLRRQN